MQGGFLNRLRLVTLALACIALSHAAPRVRKIVLLAGVKSHGAGEHEYLATMKLIQADLPDFRSEVYADGWPADARTLDDADTIVVMSDGQDHDTPTRVPFMTPERMKVMEKEMKRGCGLVMIHYSTFISFPYDGQTLDWLGGYFNWDEKRGPVSQIKTLSADVVPATPAHQILRGVEPFHIHDEFYYKLKFRENDPRLIPILRVPALAESPIDQVVAWAVQRDDGGRGFGITSGHYFANWKDDNFRKLMLNAVVWTSGADVPSGGIRSQSGWATFSGDAQRTGWARDEVSLAPDNVHNLGMLWSSKLSSQPKQMTGPTTPVVVAENGRDGVLVAGASDDAFLVDAATGKRLWTRHFNIHGAPQRPPSWNCPGALNATPVVDNRSGAAFLVSSDGILYSLDVRNGEDRRPPIQFVPPFSKNWSLTLSNGVLYTTTSQDCNAASSGVYAFDTRDPAAGVRFFQANTTGAGIWGRAGATVDGAGRVIVSTGDGQFDPDLKKFANSILALDPKTLQISDYYTPANFDFLQRKDLDLGNTSTTVFPYEGKELIAAAAKEGVVYLLDTQSMGGDDHHAPLFRSPVYLNENAKLQLHGFWGALSTCLDDAGTRWLFAPAWGPPTAAANVSFRYGQVTHGSIIAFTIRQIGAVPQIVPVWMSRDLSYPEPVVVSNGLVFALANGANEVLDDLVTGHMLTGEERASHPSGHAVLSVLDARTGEELYSSRDTIPGWTHFGGLALLDGRVFLTTHDGTLYAFGLNSSTNQVTSVAPLTQKRHTRGSLRLDVSQKSHNRLSVNL
jgi:type 1 glutamine amidotransferase